MCTDSHGNLYVVQFVETQNDEFEVINVYNAGFTTSTPARTITPSADTFFEGITVDGSGTISTTASSSPDFDPEIAIFSTSTNTDPPPSSPARPPRSETPPASRSIQSVPSTCAITRLAVPSSSPVPARTPLQPHLPEDNPIVVDVFNPSADGNVAPTSSFTTTTLGGNGRGLAIH